MIIREPLIQATYYYLHEAPGESASRREDRYRLFVEDTQRMFASVAGWLAMSAPDLPALAPVERPTQALHPLMAPAELRGHTNAAAWLQPTLCAICSAARGLGPARRSRAHRLADA